MTVQLRDVSIPIIAERWKVPTTTLSQWRWNGKGPQFIRLGKHIVYRLQDVELFEEQKLRRDTTRTGYVLSLKEETRIERRG